METVIVSLICVALMIIGGMTLSQGFLTAVDSSTVGWDEMESRDQDIMRTDLHALSANMTDANHVEIALRNNGQTKLSDFEKWDVIIQYHNAGGDQYVQWLPYTSGAPGDNQWTVKGIYLNSDNETQVEVYDPNILNPGEEMKIRARISPSSGATSTNWATMSTANGISASVIFSGYNP
jgi:hypothetical protein